MSVLRSQHSHSSICPVIDHWESMALCWTEQWPNHLHAAYNYHHVVIPVSLNVFFFWHFSLGWGRPAPGPSPHFVLQIKCTLHEFSPPIKIHSISPPIKRFSVSPCVGTSFPPVQISSWTRICLLRVKWVSFKGNLVYIHPVKISPTRHHNVGIPFKYLFYP